MKTKPNVPDTIFLGDEEYSWRMDWNVNGWLFVATLISAFGDIIFHRVVSGWPLIWRVTIVLAQFAALALWVRALARWIRGMDEMHRRITGAAVSFAVAATFFFIMLWHRLDAAGLFRVILPGRGSWDIATVGHAFLLLTFFYFAAISILNRRYR
jgi:hypothetical protein